MNENVLSKELTRRDQIVIALIAKCAYEAILICHEENEDEETLDRYLEILQTLYDVDSSKAAALVLILLKQSTYDEELLNASFLEVLLLENFDTNYLKNETRRVKDYELAYDKLHDYWVEKIESKASKSIESFALKGISKVTGGAGKVFEKIPVINKSQIDENLIKAGDWIANANEDKIEKSSKLLTDSKVNLIGPFIENIETIDIIYNKPRKLIFDAENIYVLKNTAE